MEWRGEGGMEWRGEGGMEWRGEGGMEWRGEGGMEYHVTLLILCTSQDERFQRTPVTNSLTSADRDDLSW